VRNHKSLAKTQKKMPKQELATETGMLALKEAEVEPGVVEPSIGKTKPAKKVPVNCLSPSKAIQLQ